MAARETLMSKGSNTVKKFAGRRFISYRGETQLVSGQPASLSWEKSWPQQSAAKSQSNFRTSLFPHPHDFVAVIQNFPVFYSFQLKGCRNQRLRKTTVGERLQPLLGSTLTSLCFCLIMTASLMPVNQNPVMKGNAKTMEAHNLPVWNSVATQDLCIDASHPSSTVSRQSGFKSAAAPVRFNFSAMNA